MNTHRLNNSYRINPKSLLLRISHAILTPLLALANSEFTFRALYSYDMPGVPDEGQYPLLAFPYLAATYHSGSIGLFTDLEFTIAGILSFALIIITGLCSTRVLTGRYKLSAILIVFIVLAGIIYRAHSHAPGNCIPTWMFDPLALVLYKEPAVVISASILLTSGLLLGFLSTYSQRHKHGFEVLPQEAPKSTIRP